MLALILAIDRPKQYEHKTTNSLTGLAGQTQKVHKIRPSADL